MSTTRDKHRALQALRQQLAVSASQNSENSPAQPLSGTHLNSTLFAAGFHEIIGETPVDIAAATAFALIAARHRKMHGRALFFGTLAGEEQECGALYGAGLDRLGLDPARICLVVAPSEKAFALGGGGGGNLSGARCLGDRARRS
jgi:hypothetical protein